MKKVIKKHKNKNQYLLTPHGIWVRDLTRQIYPVEINNLTSRDDQQMLINNENYNNSLQIPNIGLEKIKSNFAVIVSDGYDFENKKELLFKVPKDALIIGTNRTLTKWPKGLRMDYYVTNNPYVDCMSCLSNFFPKCIISSRTYPEFARAYKSNRGLLYKYYPVKEPRFGGNSNSTYYVDDYRNPICAAISLSYRFGVNKILMFCCDDAFENERSGSEKLDNGLYLYPQHRIAHSIMDSMFYWLTNQQYNSLKVFDFSSGPKYEFATYISAEDIGDFLNANVSRVAEKSISRPSGLGDQGFWQTEIQKWSLKR